MLVFADVVASDIQMMWRALGRDDFSVELRDELYSEGKPAVLRIMYGRGRPETEAHDLLCEVKEQIIAELGTRRWAESIPALNIRSGLFQPESSFVHAVQGMTADTTHAVMMMMQGWLRLNEHREQTAEILGEKHDGMFMLVDSFFAEMYLAKISEFYQALGVSEIKTKVIRFDRELSN